MYADLADGTFRFYGIKNGFNPDASGLIWDL